MVNDNKPRPARKTWLKWLWISLVGIVAIYIGFAASINLGWSNRVVKNITKYLPVPVSLVNWQPVWANDFFQQYAGLSSYQAYMTKNGSTETVTSIELKATALTKTINDLVISNLLKTNDLKLTKADINLSYTNQANQSGNSSSVENSLKEIYNWQPSQFKNYVVKIDLSRERLREKFAFSSDLNGAGLKQAQTISALLKEGKQSFTDIAKSYSQDEYATNGGDIGFVGRGSMTKELEDAAFSLAINQVSDVIQSKYGFHILKVTEKKGEGVDEQVHLQAIFVNAPAVDDAIQKYLEQHRFVVFLHGFSWSTKSLKIVADVKTPAVSSNTNK